MLAAPALPEEPPEPVVATLVRDARRPLQPRAVLFVHGWNDYFFHDHVADWFGERGWTLYALDLRRYGRSLREGQLRGYIAELTDYFEELDAALALIAERHDGVLLVGHSTGGLTASLYAAARPGAFVGVVLNSPWLDLHGPPALAAVLRPALSTWSRRNPTSVLKLPDTGGDNYVRALHSDFDGEWAYSTDLKSAAPVPIRVGWLRAVLHGHAAVAKGLGIDAPVFVATAARSWFGTRYGKRLQTSDTVLDVEKITAKAWRLGPRVTIVRVLDGMHDLFLSRPEPRARLFAELERWLDAYAR